MKIRFLFDIENILADWGISEKLAGQLNIVFGIAIILLLAFLSDIITRRIILNVIRVIVRRTKTSWDDIILQKKVFNKLSHLAPAVVLYFSVKFVFAGNLQLSLFLQGGIKIYMILISLLVLNSFLLALLTIYRTLPIAENRPIKGYLQVIQIILYGIAIILMLSILIGKSPNKLFTGLGAMAAILLLVFKDTILGFVASIQLSANNMVRIGDWISMPSHKADGTVLEISLNTVKVQNWDKTISTVPTYALVSESFGNWRGMEESGGRRIKRHIMIDMQSVKFCTPEMLLRFEKIIYLKAYIEQKQKEIAKYNTENKIDESIRVNGRRMTNLGTFRKYLEFYLQNHPKVNKDMTFLVRQLQPSEKGMPIEIYIFCTDQRWAYYESIQADIFDHILAVIPEFDLRVFQNPSGEDFKQLTN